VKAQILFAVGFEPVRLAADGCVSFLGELTINADGSPRAYGPAGTRPLDHLANAGRPGKWWGIATHNGKPGGRPLIQGPQDPRPGFYVSTTAYKVPGFRHGDPRRELDSEKVPFIVAPRQLIRAVAGVVLGCKGRVTDTRTGKSVDAVVGDIGPAHHLGEASIAAAAALGVPTDAKKGGSSSRTFRYEMWTDIPAPGFRLQPRLSAARLAVLDSVETAIYV
jgi:hypothetical protein